MARSAKKTDSVLQLRRLQNCRKMKMDQREYKPEI